VVSSLLSKEIAPDYSEEIATEYKELREQHYRNLKDRKYLTIEQARANAPVINWDLVNPTVPSFLGVKAIKNYHLEDVIARIDWNPFFSVWELKGKHPNRGYPKVFNDPAVGPEAKKVFDDAQRMIQNIVKQNLLVGHAVVGFFPANSKGDDVEVFADEKRDTPIATLFGLRQQAEKEGAYISFGDYIAPKSSGKKDYIGLFAVTSGFGLEDVVEKFKLDHDEYSVIMVKALADRLAEAMAEHLHEVIRKEMWGYAKDENLSNEDMFRAEPKYQGIRPAPGYPSQPDHTEKLTLWKLLQVEEHTGITLTESLAMLPGSSVCGLYFANPHAQYFNVNKIGRDQVHDYARRKGVNVLESERWLSQILGYDPDAPETETAGR